MARMVQFVCHKCNKEFALQDGLTEKEETAIQDRSNIYQIVMEKVGGFTLDFITQLRKHHEECDGVVSFSKTGSVD